MSRYASPLLPVHPRPLIPSPHPLLPIVSNTHPLPQADKDTSNPTELASRTVKYINQKYDPDNRDATTSTARDVVEGPLGQVAGKAADIAEGVKQKVMGAAGAINELGSGSTSQVGAKAKGALNDMAEAVNLNDGVDERDEVVVVRGRVMKRKQRGGYVEEELEEDERMTMSEEAVSEFVFGALGRVS